MTPKAVLTYEDDVKPAALVDQSHAAMVALTEKLRQSGFWKNLRTAGGAGSGNFGHEGRPGEVGGSTEGGRDTRAIVERRVLTVAQELGIDPSIIHVIDEEPKTFTLGDQTLQEAGHFNPTTGQIEINARNSYDDRMSITNGIAAHEISHAMYDAVKKESDKEFVQYLDLALEKHPKGTKASDGYTEWRKQRFTGQAINPGYEKEIAEMFPASYALSPLADGAMFTGISKKVQDENGHSRYAAKYWQRDANGVVRHEAATNETLAEVTRYLTHPMSWEEPHTPASDSPWVETSKRMRKVFATLKAKR